MASLATCTSKLQTMVRIASRSAGGVLIIETVRSPAKVWCKVRGIGVAVRVSKSTLACMVLSFCLCLTPKRCSSSTMVKPKSAKVKVSDNKRWVPIITRISPFFSSRVMRSVSFLPCRREISSTFKPNPEKRSAKLL